MATSPVQQSSWAIQLDRALAAMLVANLGWTTWHLGGVVGEAMAWSFPALMLGVAMVWIRWWVWQPQGAPRGWWLPLPMLAYVGLHMAGLAELPGRARLDGLQWWWMAGAFWCGLQVVRERGARNLLWAGTGALILVGLGLAVYQRWVNPEWLPWGRKQGEVFFHRPAGPFGVPNSFAMWCLLAVMPALGVIVMRRPVDRLARGFAAVVAVAGLVAICLTLSRGVWISLVAVLLLGGLIRTRGGWGQKALWAGGLASVVVLVLVFAYQFSPVVRDRIDTTIAHRGELSRPHMWGMAIGLWQDSPWWGTGGGSFEALQERHRPIRFRDEPFWAHNDYLNTLSDYGLVGFLLSIGVGGVVLIRGTWSILRGSKDRDRGRASGSSERRLACGLGLWGLAVGCVVDFHLEIPAIGMLAGWLSAEWMRPSQRSEARAVSSVGPRAVAGLAAVTLVVLAVVEASPRYRADSLRFFARDRLDSTARMENNAARHALIERQVEALRESVQLAPDNDQGWSDLAYGTALLAHGAPKDKLRLGEEAEHAAREALKRGESVAYNWVRLGTALDLQGKWGEAGLAFGKAVKLAPHNALVWYYQAFHFHLRPVGLPLAKAALATCLRLDPHLSEGKALRAALERSH